GAGGSVPQQHAASAPPSSSSSSSSSSGRAPLDWLLTDRGPFYRAQEYVDFMERYRQGFTTRYRIYREFARWKVNNLALERKDFFSLPLPLAPEFIRNIRLLGRRPSPQQITDSLIKKYGTHFLLAATLGGEESLTIFVDKRKLSRRFEESEEFQALVKRLPGDRFLNRTAISHFWAMDLDIQHRYQQLGTSLKLLSRKTHRLIRRLFNLSKRCHRQPRFQLPKERSLPYWWSRAQSLLYCSETTVPGTFLEESHSCTCPSDQPSCQGSIPCALGEGPACASCAEDNSTRCGTCNHGYVLTQGFCRPEVADSLEHYLGLETDLQDLELKYLLQKRDSRIEVHSIFISNDMRLGSWFDPSWRKRMLLTLKSNKYKPGLVHVMLALSLQICLTKNSTLEPVMAIYVNPFGGSHSESWFMPVNEGSFPDWERTSVDASAQCQNWTLTLGNKWKTFFETVHVYLRSRIKSLDDSSNETIYYEPLEMADPSKNLGYMKINSLQVFGYSLPFEPDAIRDLILQLDYPYTQGSQDSAMLQLLEIRDRVNRLSPPGKTHLDLFTCLLRHRLKLANNEVARIQSSLRAFNAKLPNAVEQETGKLCS
ncbi:PREDICTED: BMP/retinoic acid-inducible neural-specific protein 3, partial [Tauraco erythrolophus]|uniref:BMP/retinoic acid-inducible neural-specific protein 3 n=1 Tax=Tauraco erythrolophus TaxID=121530 RepID=UPI000523C3E4